jgi:4'-phosphopantetheinyl transferase
LTTHALRPVVWSVRIDSEAAAAALAVAPHTDRDLAEFAAAPDAGNRLLRRRLVRALLSRLAGLPSAAILFGRTAAGAPSVLSPKGVHMSVAGRAPLCLIGIAPEPLGVDVEPLDAAPPLWDMLTQGEAAAIRAQPQREQPHEWLRRWVAKEAHAKRLGYARHADPARVETRAEGEDRVRVASAEGSSLCRLRIVAGRIEALALAD